MSAGSRGRCMISASRSSSSISRCTIQLPIELRDSWFDTLDRPVGARTVLHFSTPLQVRPVPGRVNVNYTMFEGNAHSPALGRAFQ